jgi:hypothetical protein
MKLRYSVRRGDVGWGVVDHQVGTVIEWHKGRDPARFAARRYNDMERKQREDQQQSREETI